MNSVFVKVSLTCILFFAALTAFSPANINNLVQEVLTESNAFRKSNGLGALEIKEELNVIARQHSENMAKGIVAFGHAGFEKRNLMASKSISGLRGFAENVAFGQETGKEAVGKWQLSAGHRQNLLGNYRFTGIGIAKDKNGRFYYTQVFGG
jgi:uncharacterized protein YkwD